MKTSILLTAQGIRLDTLLCAQHAAHEADEDSPGYKVTQADCSLDGCGRHKSPAFLMEGDKTVSRDQFSDGSVPRVLAGAEEGSWGKMHPVKDGAVSSSSS